MLSKKDHAKYLRSGVPNTECRLSLARRDDFDLAARMLTLAGVAGDDDSGTQRAPRKSVRTAYVRPQ